MVGTKRRQRICERMHAPLAQNTPRKAQSERGEHWGWSVARPA